MLSCFVGCRDNSFESLEDEMVFDATFDSGNLKTYRYLGNHRFLVQPQPDYGRDGAVGTSQMEASWDGRTWWYHFSITIDEQHLPLPIKLELDASKMWLKQMYTADKVPVVSCDGETWRFVKNWDSMEYKRGVPLENPVISHTLTCPTTYVAMATPYPWAKMETFLESIFTSPYIIQHDIIGHTPPGANKIELPLHYLLLKDPGDQPDKRNVVVTSGQHPGETTNSWMLTGLVEFLLSDAPLAHSLRQTFAFHIYPAVNPEGVKYGHYRRTADSPLNTNRAWDGNEVLEVVTVRDHILSQTNGRADYFFDLHGSQRWKHFIYHGNNKPGAHELVEAVAARNPNVDVNFGQKSNFKYTGSARRWALKTLRSHDDDQKPPLSFTPEGSYAQGSWEGKPNQKADWKALGAALVQAIGDVEGLEQ